MRTPHRYAASLLWLATMVFGVLPVAGLCAPQSPPATVLARTIPIAETQQAVGTVRPRTETRIEAQITARILEMRIRPGTRVTRGDILVVLDTRELSSRKEQAQQAITSASAMTQQSRQALASAQAAFTKAEAQYKRIRSLFETKTVAKSEMDQAEAMYAQAEAELQRAKEGVGGALATESRTRKMLEEAGIALDYGVIRALEDGEVVRREAEPGDLAFPGKTLAVLQTGGSLRLEAQVREGLIQLVRPGTQLPVIISALSDLPLAGTVEEVVPAADPQSRTFEVRVGLPVASGLYPGMFGRLLITVGTREGIVIPAKAVSRVGQLETVRILEGETVTTIYVKTGRLVGEDIEILSGLRGGEAVVVENGHAR